MAALGRLASGAPRQPGFPRESWVNLLARTGASGEHPADAGCGARRNESEARIHVEPAPLAAGILKETSFMQLRPGEPNEAGMLPERIDRARELCAGWVASGHTPALVALVARRGVIVLHEAFGKLRPEPDSPPVERNTIFPIMSITKPMVATLVMQLVEDGLLGLNRPLRDYLPEVTGEGTEQVLVHHLLTFTPGWDEFALITNVLIQRGDLVDRPAEEVFRAICEVIEKAPLALPPGQVMHYGFLSYVLLQKLIERISGRPFAELMRERLFDPLGMRDSCVIVPESVRSRVVKRPPGAPWNQSMGAMAAIDSQRSEENHNVFASARDVAVFAQMFLNGGSYGGARVLSRPAVSEMTRVQTPGIPVIMGASAPKQASYGYGWFIRTDEKWRYWDGSLQSRGEFHHQGAGGVLVWVDPRDEIVGVYFSVDLAETPELEPLWNADLFQNAISSAVAD
jgi:CubicO group peptidase (beta-lactamase class C family)